MIIEPLMPPPVLPLEDQEARDIARRWGNASGSQILLDYGATGLVEDRKRLTDAIKGIRTLLKHPFELDRLLHHIGNPCRYESAARDQGWIVGNRGIVHAHDYERAITYGSWRECCEAEDIPVAESSDTDP